MGALFDQQRDERSGTLVVCSTQASSDLVATMLAAHGITSATSWLYAAYPSIGWVEGFAVTVRAGEEARARELLAALSDEDAITLVPPDA